MIKAAGLCKSFGGQILLRQADWFVGPQDRVALIGRNGSGKSTLLKIVADLESYDAGRVERPSPSEIGYLAQADFVIGGGTVWEEAREAFGEVLALEEERAALEARLERATESNQALETLSVRHGEILERLQILGAHDVDRQVHRVLTGLGFVESDFERPVANLSGGWQMRAALARMLLRRPQVLLLDEPTNHLDLEAREWLEGYLRDYPYAFVLVSHDRYFLDVTVKRISEIVGYRLEEYAGNYSFYERERDARYAQRLKAYEEQQSEIRRIEQFIQRNRANKRLASRTHSRMVALEKMERLEPPEPPRRGIRVRYPNCPHSGRIPLELRQASKAYGTTRVLEHVDLRIERGRRVALVGPNGAGKSTLMRLLAGRETPDRGARQLGYRAEIAFFAQDEGQRLDRRATVYETVLEHAPNDFVPEVRSLLGAFLFSGDSVDKRVAALSGGELNRLAIACLLVRPSNVLLLDEPTNHLDIVSKEALLDSLQGYPGTIVFVSHDRHFLDALADHVVEVGAGGAREHPGTYESYVWAKAHGGQRPGRGGGAEREDGRRVDGPTPAAADRGAPPASGSRPLGGQREAPAPARPAAGTPRGRGSRARRKGRRKGSGRRASDVEREIEELEARRARYEQALAHPSLAADPSKTAFYVRELKALHAPLERLYAEWTALADNERGARGF